MLQVDLRRASVLSGVLCSSLNGEARAVRGKARPSWINKQLLSNHPKHGLVNLPPVGRVWFDLNRGTLYPQPSMIDAGLDQPTLICRYFGDFGHTHAVRAVGSL